MAERTISAMLLIIAVIHLIPITGFLGAERLAALYGVSIHDDTLEILMRHRGMLFGILGAFFAYAAFVPAARPAAFLGAVLSLGSFFYLAASASVVSAAIRKVVIADVVASVCLVVAVALHVLSRHG